MSEKFNAGHLYGSLNSMRAAIFLISKENYFFNALLNRFFKGVFKNVQQDRSMTEHGIRQLYLTTLLVYIRSIR